jgi:hypothetical protein
MNAPCPLLLQVLSRNGGEAVSAFKQPVMKVQMAEKLPSGAKQVAEKGLVPMGNCEKHTSGPKGPVDLLPLTPG